MAKARNDVASMAFKTEEQEEPLPSASRDLRNDGADAEVEVICISDSDDEATTREHAARQEHCMPSSERSPAPAAQIRAQLQIQPQAPSPAHHPRDTGAGRVATGTQPMELDGGRGSHDASADGASGDAIMGLLELLAPVVICKSSSMLAIPDACVRADMGVAAVEGRLTYLVRALGLLIRGGHFLCERERGLYYPFLDGMEWTVPAHAFASGRFLTFAQNLCFRTSHCPTSPFP